MSNNTITIKGIAKNAVDPPQQDQYVLRRDSENEQSTAAYRAAAE
jgi:hypothetical protein